MKSIALIALLTAAATPALANGQLDVTVSDRSVPAFLLAIDAEIRTEGAIETTAERQPLLRSRTRISADDIFAQISAESDD